MPHSIEVTIKNLEWFKIKDIDAVKKELQTLDSEGKQINPTDYYVKYLTPLIPGYFKASREGTGLWPSPDGVSFRGFLQIAFDGHFPVETLKQYWLLMLVKEQMEPSNNGSYLLRALENSYSEGLVLILDMYQKCVTEFPEYTESVVHRLKKADEELITSMSYEKTDALEKFQDILTKIRELPQPKLCTNVELVQALASMLQSLEAKNPQADAAHNNLVSKIITSGGSPLHLKNDAESAPTVNNSETSNCSIQ